MSNSMKAIAVDGGVGPASALKVVQRSIPKPGPGEILIRVAAAGLNRADIVQRQGLYPLPPGVPETIGLEVSGVVEVGAGRWRAGDRVCALLNGGGYAGYAVCDHRHALPVPSTMTDVEAAATPETTFTVYANVFEHGRLTAGETFMVHGATSGIGATAIQMAKAAGATVIATSRGADKARLALDIGADASVDVGAEDFSEVANRLGGCDVILDMVGGDYLAKDLAAVRMDGRIVFIAAQAGMEASLNLMALMVKRAILTGSALRPRSTDEKARIAAGVEAVVWPWIEAGLVRPPVECVFPLERAAEAHALMESGQYAGKIVLTL